MNKIEIWQFYLARNPGLEGTEDGEVTLTRRGLKKLVELTYDLAHEQGVRNGRALEAMQRDQQERDARQHAGSLWDLFEKPPFKPFKP